MMGKGGFNEESRLFSFREVHVEKSERGAEPMRRGIVLLAVVIMIAGCGQLARESEFWDHRSMYQDWGHLYFSMGGYRNCDAEDVLKSTRDGWWGITMPCGAAAAEAVPVAQGRKPKEPPKKEAVAPEKKIDRKEAPVIKKKEKKKKKKTRSKKKKAANS